MIQVFPFIGGFIVGCLGTLIGAGGGFILTPILIFLFPTMLPVKLTAISLLGVAANSSSGSLSYSYKRQVHWPSVFLFGAFAIPGVFIGVALGDRISRGVFEFLFGLFLLSLSLFLFYKNFILKRNIERNDSFWTQKCKFLGSGISFFIGIVSSFLGIGGGVIHVPLLTEVLEYPIHLAAGTSHAILALTSLIAVLDHYFSGDLNQLDSWVLFLVVGLAIGAQLGAYFSKKVSSKHIKSILTIALLAVALRLVCKSIILF